MSNMLEKFYVVFPPPVEYVTFFKLNDAIDYVFRINSLENFPDCVIADRGISFWDKTPEDRLEPYWWIDKHTRIYDIPKNAWMSKEEYLYYLEQREHYFQKKRGRHG